MIKLKKIYTLIALLLIIISIYYSKNLRLDASSDTLILQNDKTFEYFEYYNNIFPSKNFLILAVKDNKIIDEKYVQNINTIKNAIDKLDKVESTFAIVDAPILILNNLNISDLNSTNVENINNTKNDLKLILNEFSTSPIFNEQLINKRKNLSSIIIYIKNNKDYETIKQKRKNSNLENDELKKLHYQYKLEKEKNNLEKKKLILDIRKIINNQNNNYQYFLGGIDMIANDTINFIKNDILIFSFAVIFFIIIILFIIYRDFKWVIIPLITTLYSLLIMTGFIGIMNWEITAISSNFISLMLILSISMNIHIINHYKINFSYLNSNYNLKITIKKMFWPCFYTALTTIVAFGSLLFSNIKPIVDFGNIMIMALLIIFITSFTILPLIISSYPKINNINGLRFSILNNFYKLSMNHSKKIIILNIIFFIISIFGIYKLNVENSFINYFKSNTDIYKGMKIIDSELGGTTPLDILIRFKDDQLNISSENIQNINDDEISLDENFELSDDIFFNHREENYWFTDEKLETIRKIHEFLEKRNEIGKVQSLYSLINMANLINKNDLTIFELSILYNEIPENYKKDLIYPFLSMDENMIKISARVKDSNKIKRNKLIVDINEYIQKEFNNISEFEVNGLLVLYNNMLQSLFNSQIKSFGIILISIFIMFLILFKSVKLSIIGIIPNIFASSMILGFIGLLNIPLDIMTITIAAITIGIAVDNTIHYIYNIKENRNIIKKNDELIKYAHNNVGKAVLTTSLTIAFGFSILSLSNFIPTILFGIFTSLAMIIAMIGVLITLPTILYKFEL